MLCQLVLTFPSSKDLWDERNVLSPISSCHCGIMKEELSYKEPQKTMTILMGLTKSFKVTRAQILMMDHLPEVNMAYSFMLKCDQQRDVSAGKKTAQLEATTFAIKESTKKLEIMNVQNMIEPITELKSVEHI